MDCSLIVLKMRWQLDCNALLSILCCAMGEKSTLMIHTQVPGQVSPIILNTSLPGCFRHSALHLIGERGFNSDGREGTFPFHKSRTHKKHKVDRNGKEKYHSIKT